MGRNLISVCDECKVQLFYLRGKESPTIQQFYESHKDHESLVRTMSDYVEEPPEDYEDVFDIYNPDSHINEVKKELSMNNKNEDRELEDQLHEISNKFVLDVYENNKKGRNSIRAGVNMNRLLKQLILQKQQEARIDEDRLAQKDLFSRKESIIRYSGDSAFEVAHALWLQNRIHELEKETPNAT